MKMCTPEEWLSHQYGVMKCLTPFWYLPTESLQALFLPFPFCPTWGQAGNKACSFPWHHWGSWSHANLGPHVGKLPLTLQSTTVKTKAFCPFTEKSEHGREDPRSISSNHLKKKKWRQEMGRTEMEVHNLTWLEIKILLKKISNSKVKRGPTDFCVFKIQVLNNSNVC